MSSPRATYLIHAAEAMAHHDCADGRSGSVATAACPNCGCDYAYCDACQGADERGWYIVTPATEWYDNEEAAEATAMAILGQMVIED